MENNVNDLVKIVLSEIQSHKDDESTQLHPYDIAEKLIEIRDFSDDEYRKVLKKIPNELLANVISELPDFMQEESAELLSTKKLADVASKMDTDDAAVLIQNISENCEDIAEEILSTFDDDDRKELEELISYEDDEAGAYMQTELFHADINESVGSSIKRLKQLKAEKELDNVYQVHITDEHHKYICSISLEELIIFDHDIIYKDIVEDRYSNQFVKDKDDIQDVVEVVSNYNLTSIPVVNENRKLVGRITSDDIYDIIQESATEQIYNLAGVNDEAEQEESIFHIGKHRAIWLGVNLITAILASVVIGFFDATIQSIVALAVLMPIVASMGGNAGTQTLTVTVRQMAIGEISESDARKTIYKEVIISLANGAVFALVIGFIAYMWFNIPLLGVVIALSMVINLFFAGFFGAVIPIWLQKLKVDPAIGSTVILTTVTDIVGFFSFLGLATIILL